jgi:hypothetical protein
MCPAATVAANAVGVDAVSITVKSSEPELAASTIFNDGNATTPYGAVPTVTLLAVNPVRSSTLMLFVPGLAEYPTLPGPPTGVSGSVCRYKRFAE